jgi:hypothetical protein
VKKEGSSGITQTASTSLLPFKESAAPGDENLHGLLRRNQPVSEGFSKNGPQKPLTKTVLAFSSEPPFRIHRFYRVDLAIAIFSEQSQMISIPNKILSEPVAWATRDHYEPLVRRLKLSKIFDA